MIRGRRPLPPPPARAPQTYVDLSDPTIEAEIGRQVALALQRETGEAYVKSPGPEPAKGPRRIMIPDAG